MSGLEKNRGGVDTAVLEKRGAGSLDDKIARLLLNVRVSAGVLKDNLLSEVHDLTENDVIVENLLFVTANAAVDNSQV